MTKIQIDKIVKYDNIIYNSVEDAMLRRIGVNGQITIPKDLVKALGLRPGDLLDIRIENSRIIMEPMTSIPKSQLPDKSG